MKNLFVSILFILGLSIIAKADVWIGPDGLEWGNVCRNGFYFTYYPDQMGQPLGTACPIRNDYGIIIGYGVVTGQ